MAIIPSNLSLSLQSNPEPHATIKETAILLIGAIKAGKLDDVKMLVQQFKKLGGSLDWEVGKGHTFLHHAAAAGHTDIALELINQGAPLNALNDSGRTPMEVALSKKQHEMASFLLSLGGTRESFDRKVLSHIWGVKGDTSINEEPTLINGKSSGAKHVRSEGSCPAGMQEAFINFTLSFFQSEQFKVMHTPLKLDSIIPAIEKIPENRTRQPKEIAQEILEGKMVLLPTGWPGHSTAVGFYGGDTVIKTNSARRKGLPSKQPVCQFFKMKKTEQLEECISGIQQKSSRSFFKKTIDLLLGLEPLRELCKSPQKVGHCTWASIKALFHAVLEVECSKVITDQTEAKQEAHRIYKAWKYYVSQTSLVDYFFSSKNRSPELITLVKQKDNQRDAKSKYWGLHVYF